jgi:hypothetical protein
MTGLGPMDGGRLEFTVDGAAYALEVPADGRLVTGWAAAGDWPQLIPGCVAPEYQAEFYDRLGDPYDRLGLYACHHIVMGLAEIIYGVPWWTAGRLAATMNASWRFFGAWSVGAGFDPSTAPAHRLMSAGLAWVYSRVEENKDARRLENELFTPPKPTRKKRMQAMPGFTPEEQAAQFQAAMANLGSGE